MDEGQMQTPEPRASQGNDEELIRKYAEDLKFLWEQYNRLTGLGFIASGTTLAFILNMIIFNGEIRQLVRETGVSLNSDWLMWSMICAGLAALSFISCRWCSQILMERQIYGRFTDAERYFREVLENETIWPTALQPKAYMSWIERKALLNVVGKLNELTKIVGIFLILLSWILCFVFAWPLVDSLSL